MGEIPPDAQDNIHAPVTRAPLKGFSLAEALNMIYNDDSHGDIYNEPPDPNVDTDEDSGEGDNGGLPNNDKVGVEWSDSYDCDSPAEPMDDEPVEGPSSFRDCPNTIIPISDESTKWITEREKGKPKPRWHKAADFDVETHKAFPSPDYSRYQNMLIIDIFELFIDDEVIQHLLEETRRYALFLNCPDPKIGAGEIRCFLAILYLSGYNNLPSKRHYWDSNDDMKNIAVTQCMRRTDFYKSSFLTLRR
ncbi:hypothetical protein JTB14_016557 [Gonioctena quinquepunctata]|nr:hypothetical protein JTB14_016557 [Gonioctena quinquepunctata]